MQTSKTASVNALKKSKVQFGKNGQTLQEASTGSAEFVQKTASSSRMTRAGAGTHLQEQGDKK
jgi:hypothetical protein